MTRGHWDGFSIVVTLVLILIFLGIALASCVTSQCAAIDQAAKASPSQAMYRC